MTHSNDLETTKVFALKDRDNLNSFLRVCSCFEDVTAHLRDEFIGILKIFLAQKLENSVWELEDRMSGKWGQPYPNLLIIYQTKDGMMNYHIMLEWGRGPRCVAYGVRNGGTKKKPSKPSQEKNNKICEILNGKVEQGGKTNDWWSWYKYLEQPYNDWNNSEVLIPMFESVSLYKSNKEFDPTVSLIGQKLVNAALALDSWFERKGD